MRWVVVTGANGFIGSYAVREFLGCGWAVIATIHRHCGSELAALEADGRVRLVRLDLADPVQVRRCLVPAVRAAGAPLDLIAHCAGRAADVGAARSFRRANLETVVNLAELILEEDGGRLVLVSSTDVYGLRDFHGEGEDELPLCMQAANPYPRYKVAAEEAIRMRLPPERYSIVRPGAVWGVGDPTLAPRVVSFLRWSPWIVLFGRWRGENRWPLAHVRNVAASLYLAGTSPQAGGMAVNVVDSERTSIREYYRMLARVYLPTRRHRELVLPYWTGCGFGTAVTWLSNLLRRDRPLFDPSLYAVRSVSHDLDFSNSRLVALASAAGRSLVSRQDGVAELACGSG